MRRTSLDNHKEHHVNEQAVFGFTAAGVMVTICAENRFQSDAPIALNVPDLTPKK